MTSFSIIQNGLAHIWAPAGQHLPPMRLWAFCQSSEHAPCSPNTPVPPKELTYAFSWVHIPLKPNKDLQRGGRMSSEPMILQFENSSRVPLGGWSQDWLSGAVAVKRNPLLVSRFLGPFTLCPVPTYILPASLSACFLPFPFHHHRLSFDLRPSLSCPTGLVSPHVSPLLLYLPPNTPNCKEVIPSSKASI